MVWCRQATSNYLSQCWPRYLSAYGVTRSQWLEYIVEYTYFVVVKSKLWRLEGVCIFWQACVVLEQRQLRLIALTISRFYWHPWCDFALQLTSLMQCLLQGCTLCCLWKVQISHTLWYDIIWYNEVRMLMIDHCRIECILENLTGVYFLSFLNAEMPLILHNKNMVIGDIATLNLFVACFITESFLTY